MRTASSNCSTMTTCASFYGRRRRASEARLISADTPCHPARSRGAVQSMSCDALAVDVILWRRLFADVKPHPRYGGNVSYETIDDSLWPFQFVRPGSTSGRGSPERTRLRADQVDARVGDTREHFERPGAVDLVHVRKHEDPDRQRLAAQGRESARDREAVQSTNFTMLDAVLDARSRAPARRPFRFFRSPCGRRVPKARYAARSREPPESSRCPS